jgi:WD40 repeat protein
LNIRSIQFSPDGRRVASSGGEVRVWDVETGKLLLDLRGHEGVVTSFAFSPDGRWIASTGRVDRTIRVANAETGELRQVISDRTIAIDALTFSPDGTRILSSGIDCVNFWDVESGRQLISVATGVGLVADLKFSPDGHTLLVCGSQTARLFDATPLAE